MENETREVTYLAVSLMLIAMVIGFIMYGLGITNRMAQARNQEVVANEKIEQYREFNGYDGQTLIGDDVIELIRNKYDTGICVFVDYRNNTSTNEITSATENIDCGYCSAHNGDHRKFNMDMYLLHDEAGDDNYFALSHNAVGAERNDLRNCFPSRSRYRAYLVYNSEDPAEFYNRLMANYDISKGGYPNTEAGKIEALDSGVKPMDPNHQITGIVLVSYETLGIPFTPVTP